jgi:hypothetical protein
MLNDVANDLKESAASVNFNNPIIVHDKVSLKLDNLWNNYIDYEREILEKLEDNYNKSVELKTRIENIYNYKPKVITKKIIYNLNPTYVSAFLINMKTKKIYNISDYIKYENDTWKLELIPFRNIIEDYKLSLNDSFKIAIIPKDIIFDKFIYSDTKFGILIDKAAIEDELAFINNIIGGEVVINRKYIITKYETDERYISLIFDKKILSNEINTIRSCSIYPYYFQKFYINISNSILHNYINADLPLGKSINKIANVINPMSENDSRNIFTIIEPELISKKEEIW